MPTSDSHIPNHPLDLLEAYAVDALDEDEAAQVESHLDDCAQCRSVAARFGQTAARLGRSVGRQEPPPELQARLMEALAPVTARAVTTGDARSKAASWALVARFVLPIAAAIVVGLFTFAVAMNIRLDNRTDNLMQDNATLTAQVVRSADEGAQNAERLRQLQVTSYWLANPANQSVTLKPPTGAGSSRGILLVSDDGRGAILMLAGMKDQSPTSTFQVWLMRHGDRVLAGTVKVDERGWGTATIRPKESFFQFEKVELVTEMAPGVAPSPDDMVLVANMPTSKPSEMVTLPPWH